MRAASRRASASSPSGYVSESAVTSTARSPSASLAARASRVESTPPEKATTTLSSSRSASSSRAYFASSAGVMRVAPSITGSPRRRTPQLALPSQARLAVERLGSHCHQRRHRARADVRDDFGRRQRAELTTGREAQPPAQAEEKAGRVEVARARRVDHRLDGLRVDHVHLAAADDDRAARAAREGRDLAVTADALQRGVEVAHLIERADLDLVGEQDVHVVLDEVEEGGAMPVDAEGIRERQRDLAPGRVGEAGGDAECFLGGRRVEEVALQIEDVPAGDEPRIDVAGAELRRRAEIGGHRALRVRRHHDDRKSTRLNSSHGYISYAVFCLEKKKRHGE